MPVMTSNEDIISTIHAMVDEAQEEIYQEKEGIYQEKIKGVIRAAANQGRTKARKERRESKIPVYKYKASWWIPRSRTMRRQTLFKSLGQAAS